MGVRFLSVLLVWFVCGMCAPGMAFTCSNVLRAVRPVEDWWGKWGLAYYVYISKEKRDEIQQMYFDPEEQKRQLILYWMSTDPLASWRRLIRELDEMGLSPVADGIRDFAEPLKAGTCVILLEIVCQGRIDSICDRENNKCYFQSIECTCAHCERYKLGCGFQPY